MVLLIYKLKNKIKYEKYNTITQTTLNMPAGMTDVQRRIEREIWERMNKDTRPNNIGAVPIEEVKKRLLNVELRNNEYQIIVNI